MNKPATHTATPAVAEAPPASAVTYVEVGANNAGQRVDNFLLTHLKDVPKSLVYRILRTGEVRLNKGRVKPTQRLQAGDILRLPPLRRGEPKPAVQASERFLNTLEQSIVYQDKALLIINKPSGIAVHGGSGVSLGVIEGFRALHPDWPYLELVHRLDRDTSGCLMLAKKPALLRELQELIRNNAVRKEYLALVQGRWPARLNRVDAALQKYVLRSGERQVQVHPEGKPALSHFSVVRHYPHASLVRIHLVTGRTHQIRVHATHAGHPVAGDEKYGDAEFNKLLRGFGLKRLFLHAAKLSLPLATYPAPLALECPLPGELQTVLNRLESAA